MKIIYIGGYGRSGSTLLDIILGQSVNVKSCGEVVFLFDEIAQNGVCSCGELIKYCPYWGPKIQKALNLYPLDDIRTSYRGLDQRALNGKTKRSYYQTQIYTKVQNILFDCPELYYVDSSKTASNASNRPFNYLEIIKSTIFFIHLKRSLIDVIISLYRGSNRSLQGKQVLSLSVMSFFNGKPHNFGFVNSSSKVLRVARGVAGYIFAHISAYWFSHTNGSIKSVSVNYEDLVRAPVETLEKIENKLGISFLGSKVASGNKEGFAVGHVVAGNRLSSSSKKLYINYE